MNLESDIKITVRRTVIGGPNLLVCVPLTAPDEPGLLKEARSVLRHRPDLLEWRVDACDALLDQDSCLLALSKLREAIGDVPLIFTCRRQREGGLARISAKQRKNLITAAVRTGYADIIDIELSNGETFVQSVLKAVHDANRRLVLSHHDFESTPNPKSITDTLFRSRALGADIAKIAVMPHKFEDVLTLMGAAIKARKGGLAIPMIAISMGTLGALTRIAGKLFGSDITFASRESKSAPGQIPIQALRKFMS